MFFRIVIVCLVLAAAYALYEIITIRSFYKGLREPLASFAIKEGNRSYLTIVEFLNYDCGSCKDTHLVLLDYAERNPDITLVVRPVPFANDGAETAAEMALAAGLQDKFWDMDRALVEYKGTLDEKFYRESAAVYDIDYERMAREAEEETVQKMARDNASAIIRTGADISPAIIVGKTLYQLEKPLTLTDLMRMVTKEKSR